MKQKNMKDMSDWYDDSSNEISRDFGSFFVLG
jgi:hypothetical protein